VTTTVDVVVIGGGPAGSTAGALLARRGYRVVVLERERFPREHVGESLLPYCYSIFEELGVLEELSRRFVRKPGVRFVDTDGATQTTWCFAHVIKDPSYLSFHVIRSEFDEVLLDNAARCGATVHQGSRVEQVNLDGEGGWVDVEASNGSAGSHRYRARFLVDASGRDTFLASRMKAKRPHPRLDRAALSTHWAGARYRGGIEEGLLQIVYLGGQKKGWIWAIPVGTDRVSVGVVLDHAHLRSRRAQLLGDGSSDWQVDLYREELFSSPFIREVLTGASMIQPLMFNGDYSYSVTRKHGSNFALVGDASAFIDPIFASGVYLSMNSSRLVADAVDVALSSENGRAEAAMAAAYAAIDGAYALVDKAIRRFYDPVAVNFAQIGSASKLIHRHHENAMAVGHFLLAGDFFEHHERYSRFLDLLSDPQLLRLYRSAVIERSEYQAPSCDVSPVEIFTPDLSEHEERRRRLLSARSPRVDGVMR
jgi:flavin-dependent dehydrogenase